MFIVLQASPSAAIVPLITFVYGIGFTAKVFAVVLLSAPVIVLNSYRGIANTPRSLLEMSNAFLASRWQRIWKVVIPAGSGLIFAGLRLGLAQGFTGAVLAELIITPTGVGDLITYYRSSRRLPGHVRGDPLDHPGRERQRDAAPAPGAAPLPTRDEAGMTDSPRAPASGGCAGHGPGGARSARRRRHEGVRRRGARPRRTSASTSQGAS